MITLWMWAAHAVPCEQPTANADVQAVLDAAYTDYERLDTDGFRARMAQLQVVLGCLEEPVQPALAASLHRAAGLEAFGHRDLDLAERSFAAARFIEPDFVFPTALVPENSPIYTYYRATKLGVVPRDPLPTPADGEIFVDGKGTLERRSTLPGVFQRSSSTGAIVYSTFLGAEAATPEYPIATRKKRRFRVNVPLVIGGGAATAASLGFLFAAQEQERLLIQRAGEQEGYTRKQAERDALRVNALSITNVGLGVVAVGFGVGAVVVGNL